MTLDLQNEIYSIIVKYRQGADEKKQDEIIMGLLRSAIDTMADRHKRAIPAKAVLEIMLRMVSELDSRVGSAHIPSNDRYWNDY